MTFHQANAQHRRNHIAEYVLDRVGVHGCQRDRGGELVVLLVNDFVQIFVMQQPVAVVETNLPQDATDWEITNHFENRWKHTNFGMAFGEEMKQNVRQRKSHEELVD